MNISLSRLFGNQSKQSTGMKSLFILSSFIFFNTAILCSQVTIGLEKAPETGALLQLKEDDLSGENSAKGLVLPRVQLTDINNLYPMFSPDPDNKYDTPEKKSEQDALHTGLVVYNMNQCLGYTGDSKGVHTWNGNKWIKLNKWTGSTVKGISGRVYKTATFGTAGEWMIENLEETTYDSQAEVQGTIPTGRVGASNITSTTITLEKVYYFPTNPVDYGAHTGVIAHDRIFYDKYKDYGIGLYYSWAAASAGVYSDVVESGVAPGPNQYSTVQGICPNGWRLPSDRDWLDLEKQILEHPELYTTQTTPGVWDSSYETNTGELDQYFRGTAGHLFESQCTPAGYTLPSGTTYKGFSKFTGFNVLEVGYMGSPAGTIPQPVSYYGSFASFWTSSNVKLLGTVSDRSVWGRGFSSADTSNGAKVARGAQAIWQLQTVRCVKARN